MKFYRDVELYRKAKGGGFVLYKRAGMTLRDMRIEEKRHPSELYIKHKDKIRGIQEAQKGFNRQLKTDVRSGNPTKVKETLVTVVEETLTEPRSGSLEGVSETVGTLVSDYSRESDVVRNLIDLSYTDYSTVLHSINVMAFTLGFAFYTNYSQADAKALKDAYDNAVGQADPRPAYKRVRKEFCRTPRLQICRGSEQRNKRTGNYLEGS